MKTYKRITFILGIVLVLPLMSSFGFAGDHKVSRETLRGINGIFVRVESLSSEIRKDGLKKQQIRTDVESKLQMAGIKVLSYEEYLLQEGHPYLYIQASVIKSQYPNIYIYHIGIELVQNANLVRNPNLIIGNILLSPKVTTWSTGSIGKSGYINDIRNFIKDEVNIFIDAYLSVNPK